LPKGNGGGTKIFALNKKKNKNWFWFDNLATRQWRRYKDICIELEKKQKLVLDNVLQP
jgi:hypothetical protein